MCWTVPDYRMDNAPSSCVDAYRVWFSAFIQMKFSELKKEEGKISGLLALDTLRLTGSGSILKKFLLLGLPLLMVVLLSYEWISFFPINALYGLMFLNVAALLVVFMIDCFYHSHYFAGIHTALPEWGVDSYGSVLPYEIHEIISRTSSPDFTAGFLGSKAGKDIMMRLNISPEIVEIYIKGDRRWIYSDSVSFSKPVDLVSYASAVFDADVSFAQLLSEHGVGRNDFIGVTEWVTDIYERRKEMLRWWGRDSLGRIRGIGKDWTRNQSDMMENLGYFAEPKNEESVYKKEINIVEKSLSRQTGKKILLVADEYRKLEAILAGLAERISDGSVLPPIQHKRLFVLDTVRLDDRAQAEGRFVTFLTELFAEVVLAEDIILVIKNFPFLVFTAKKRGIKLSDVLKPYLSSGRIDVIALSTTNAFGEFVKPDKELSVHFDNIHFETQERKIILRALQQKAYLAEQRGKIFFTYQSLVTLADIAIKSHGEHLAEYRALGLFIEIIPKIIKKGVKTVTVSDIVALAH